MALFMGIDDVGLDDPAKQPVPVQDQLWKTNPAFGVAVIEAEPPALTHSLEGVVEPPPEGETATVRKYWC
jgi:hypothetical protein